MKNVKDAYKEYAVTLNQCDKALDDLYHEYAASWHISDAALWVLYAIYDAEETITQADICSCWFFSRQTINTALKGLEQQGVIALESVPGNRKSKAIRFTQEGMKTAEGILEPLLEAERKVFNTLSDEENRIFAELSQKRCSLLREYLKTV